MNRPYYPVPTKTLFPRVILEQAALLLCSATRNFYNALSFEILRFRIPTASSLNKVKNLGGDAPLENDAKDKINQMMKARGVNGNRGGAVKDIGRIIMFNVVGEGFSLPRIIDT